MRRLVCLLLVLFALPALAADEDRGLRGWYLGLGMGMQVGNGADADDRATATFIGTGGHLRFGEEVLPRFTLGLELAGGGGSGDGYDASVGGFFLQTTLRPLSSAEPLLFLAGTGLGGGGYTQTADGGADGIAAGAIFQLGALYEITLDRNPPHEAFMVVPGLRWTYVPPSGSSNVYVSLFTVGVEATWYAGRQ